MSCPSPANWGALKLGHTLAACLHDGDRVYRVVGVTKRRVELAVVDCGPAIPAWFKRCDPRLKGCTSWPAGTQSAGLDGISALCGDKPRPSGHALWPGLQQPGGATNALGQTQDGGECVVDGFVHVHGGVFKCAAAEVLRRERRLMTTGHITRRALELGLLGTLPGKTPDATMASTLYTDVKPKRSKGKAPVSLFVRPSEGLFGLRCWGDDPLLAHLVVPAQPAAPKYGAPQSPGLRARAVNGAAPGLEAGSLGSADGARQGSPPSAASSQGAPGVPRVRPGTPMKDDQAAALHRSSSGDVRTASEEASVAELPQLGTPLKRARTPSTRMLTAGQLDGAVDEGEGPDGSPLRSVRRQRTTLGSTRAATRSAAAPAPGVLLLLQAAEALGSGALAAKMPQLEPQAIPSVSELPPTATSHPVTPVYTRGPTQPAPACPLLAAEVLPSLGDAIVARLTPIVGHNDTLLSCALWSFSRKACSQGRAAEADAAAVKAWTHFCRATCGTAHPATVTPEMYSAWHAMTADVARLVPITTPC